MLGGGRLGMIYGSGGSITLTVDTGARLVPLAATGLAVGEALT